MTTDLTTGLIWSSTLPTWQRTYYEALLLETLRTKSILVPFTIMKEDPAAQKTGTVVYSEVFDTDPNFNALDENSIWLKGASLDSRTVSITLAIYGDTLKFSDYADVVQYINNGDLKGLVREKIGQNQTDMLDLLARNAFLSHPNKWFAGGQKASRALIAQTDLFDPDQAELARTHLEELEVPGVKGNEDGGPTIVCVTTPRVIHDIRTAAGSKWIETNMYSQTLRKFTAEVGTWGGVRFIKTNRLRLRNLGAVKVQTTLTAPTVGGQGAAATVDNVYAVGQAASTRTIPVTSSAGFVVGQYVTISDATVTAANGNVPIETDGTAETRRIVAVGVGTLSFEKPLLKPHGTGDFVTNGIDIHCSVFMGGPAVVMAVGERPNVIVPPKYDDLMMVNRIGWRAFLKFQMFRPEYIEVHENAGSLG
jgi:N4-gp56 family major capsid protein